MLTSELNECDVPKSNGSRFLFLRSSLLPLFLDRAVDDLEKELTNEKREKKKEENKKKRERRKDIKNI